MLKDFKDQSFGGAFIHPRPGLETEYLSDEWFRLWKYSVEKGGNRYTIVNQMIIYFRLRFRLHLVQEAEKPERNLVPIPDLNRVDGKITVFFVFYLIK